MFKDIFSIGQLIEIITSQNAKRIKVTLVEGWTFNQFADELMKTLQIDIFEFNRICQNAEFIQEMDIDASSLEGFLFPDTYIFLSSYTEEDIVKTLVNQ